MKIADGDVRSVKPAKQAYDAVLHFNWRIAPVQFGLSSPSQILAELIRAAGFKAVLYQSSKGPGICHAMFPDKLFDASFVELTDVPPDGVTYQDWTPRPRLSWLDGIALPVGFGRSSPEGG